MNKYTLIVAIMTFCSVVVANADESIIRTIDSTEQCCFEICKEKVPNPFERGYAQGFWINFSIPFASEVTILILTPADDTVYSFGSRRLKSGKHNVTWSCRDSYLDLPLGPNNFLLDLEASYTIRGVNGSYQIKLPFDILYEGKEPEKEK